MRVLTHWLFPPPPPNTIVINMCVVTAISLLTHAHNKASSPSLSAEKMFQQTNKCDGGI